MDEENFLDISDEDFEKMGMYPPSSSASEESDTDESLEESDALDQDESLEEEPQDTSETDEDDEDDDQDEGEAESQGQEDEESESDDEEEDSDNEDEEQEEEDEANDDAKSEAEKFYAKLTSPIKANGKEHVIKDADEAERLIQMGIGYTKRLEELKPARQLFKTFEQHNMLDNESISFAIDLVQGNKDAILKLIKDKGINPLDLDTDDNIDYKSSVELAPEQSVDFDDVIHSIKDSEHYDATINIVRSWDAKSKQDVSNNPAQIAHLNEHVANGTYQKVSAEVEKLIALGNPDLKAMSELDRYKAVGNWMAQEGRLAPPSASGQSTTDEGEKVLPKAGNKSNPKTAKKKKAAGVPRSKAKVSSKAINPLNMSDEEFEKFASKYS